MDIYRANNQRDAQANIPPARTNIRREKIKLANAILAISTEAFITSTVMNKSGFPFIYISGGGNGTKFDTKFKKEFLLPKKGQNKVEKIYIYISPVQEAHETVALGLFVPLFSDDSSLGERGIFLERLRQVIVVHFVAQISHEQSVVVWDAWGGGEIKGTWSGCGDQRRTTTGTYCVISAGDNRSTTEKEVAID